MQGLATLIDGDMERSQACLGFEEFIVSVYSNSYFSSPSCYPMKALIKKIQSQGDQCKRKKDGTDVDHTTAKGHKMNSFSSKCNAIAFFGKFGIRNYASMQSEQNQWSFSYLGHGESLTTTSVIYRSVQDSS